MESLCRNCGTPDSWHSEVDGQCPDDDGPHYDSVAAYDAHETADCSIHGPFYSGFAHCPTCEAMSESTAEENVCQRCGYRGPCKTCPRCVVPTFPALYSEAWPVPCAVAMAPREERNANEESRARIAEAFGELDEAVCQSFATHPTHPIHSHRGSFGAICLSH
jgi:hypothetical protein